MRDSQKFIISVVTCELVGLAATLFTISAIPTWYATLNKPSFSPPNWVFGPVWTTLYFLMGLSAFLIWKKGLKNKKVKRALTYFFIQLVFNFLWSVLFFGLHNPLLGLLDIVLLLISIVLTIIIFYKISKAASYLLIPYFLWVSFATILNLSLVVLNP
jgi:tryptophan-rich sensory protein